MYIGVVRKLFGLGLVIAFAGSMSVSAAYADKKTDDAVKGAIIGAGVGALVGGTEGAVVGGVAGAIIGKNKN